MFADRSDAGRRLASKLDSYRDTPVVVLGVARGGVPVASEVAAALGAPLDVVVVRKLGVPSQPELGMGAIGEGGVRVLDDDVMLRTAVTTQEVATVEARERVELDRRVRRYRGDRPAVSLSGRTAVVVDDGIATGSTARAACRVARAHGAARVVLAVPVAPPGWEARVGRDADECVCLATPAPFFGIGAFYDDFSQTTDADVVASVERAASRGRGAQSDEDVEVLAGPVRLAGHLAVPEHASGMVLFAHGSGSSRHSPRNRFVAGVFNRAGLGSLLFDLLTAEEERDRANVFDVRMLARRLLDATSWLRDQPGCATLPLGYFGASTGAAAALWAAAEPGADVAAVVSRGGRPDLAIDCLGAVSAPTLFIVGGLDGLVYELNREALARMRCEARLFVVPGATHLFEEIGTLQTAADAACDWFTSHLVPAAASS